VRPPIDGPPTIGAPLDHGAVGEWCGGRCLVGVTGDQLISRAQRHDVGVDQLLALVGLTAGRCMICRSCHAQAVDVSRSGGEVRGLICRYCKTRVATYDGSYGPDAPFYRACRCTDRGTEWLIRIQAATAQYLERTASADSVAAGPQHRGNRAILAEIIRDVQARGVDPYNVWSTGSIESLPRLARPPAVARETGEATRRDPPLARPSCARDCQQHDEHIYIACFPTPTIVRDRDYHRGDDMTDYPISHYVGWTRQLPPVKRVAQHGRTCVDALIKIMPGTEQEEALLKAAAACPQCGQQLWYYRADPPSKPNTP